MEYKLVLLHWYKILVSYHIKYLTRQSKAHRLFPSLLESLPVLAIDNYYDFNQPFISRSNLLESLGIYLRNSPTRFLLYGGSPKMVITQSKLVLQDYLREGFGIEDNVIVLPSVSNRSKKTIVQKILDNPSVMMEIARFAGSKKKIVLISWGITPDLYELVRMMDELGVEVLLTEAPAKKDLSIQQYIDTKVGFRAIASSVFGQEKTLPQGFICRNQQEVRNAVEWFTSRSHSYVIKGNIGILGKSVMIGEPGVFDQAQFEIIAAYNDDDLYVVEKFIPSPKALSPSIEYYVPPLGQSKPKMSCIGVQLLLNGINFIGWSMTKEHRQEEWYQLLIERGERLANHLQSLGYVGHFDIDAIVDAKGNPWLTEVNARRTGGTHEHELCLRLFGANYLDRVATISNGRFQVGAFDLTDLYKLSRDVLYSHGSDRGIIFLEANSLASDGIVSVLALGRTQNEAIAYLSQLKNKLPSPNA